MNNDTNFELAKLYIEKTVDFSKITPEQLLDTYCEINERLRDHYNENHKKIKAKK